MAEKLSAIIVEAVGRQTRAQRLALYLIYVRLFHQGSRPAAARCAEDHAVREVPQVSGFEEDDLYAALDYLEAQQAAGLLTDGQGEPLSIQLDRGHTGDPLTFLDAVQALKMRSGAEEVALVGDRGMIKALGKKAVGEAKFLAKARRQDFDKPPVLLR